jgi:hypothetical protein
MNLIKEEKLIILILIDYRVISMKKTNYDDCCLMLINILFIND